MHQAKNKLPYPIYTVTCDGDNTVAFAIEPVIHYGYIEWFDTSKQRRFRMSRILENIHGKFVFERREGTEEPISVYELERLSLAGYEKKRHQLIAPRDFDTVEELMTALLATKKGAY